MPSSRRRKTKPGQETQPISGKLEAIDSWLQKMLDRFPQKGTISVDEIQDWHSDLNPFSLQAIEFAFETHRRNAIFFPMAGQILDLCMSYEPVIPEKPKCDAICKARHGRGYHWKDMLWLMLELRIPAAMGQKQKPHKLTDGEMTAAMEKLDRLRGGAPEFRVSLYE